MLESQGTIEIINMVDGPRPYQEYIITLLPGSIALAVSGVLWPFSHRFLKPISRCLFGLAILYLLAIGKIMLRWGILWRIAPETILPWTEYVALGAWYGASILIFIWCRRFTHYIISRHGK